MKRPVRLLSALLVLILVFTAASCGGGADADGWRGSWVSDKKALALYVAAVNAVKQENAGFTADRNTSVSDVTAADGASPLADNIVGLIVRALAGAGDGTTTVEKGDESRVRSLFPLAGRPVGAEILEGSVISDVSCERNGGLYRITISFAPVLNAEPGDGALGGILDPVPRQDAFDLISTYAVILDKDRFRMDFSYHDCSAVAVIERKTGRLTRLTHRLNIDLDFALDADLIAFSTDFVNATGKATAVREYYDFVY